MTLCNCQDDDANAITPILAEAQLSAETNDGCPAIVANHGRIVVVDATVLAGGVEPNIRSGTCEHVYFNHVCVWCLVLAYCGIDRTARGFEAYLDATSDGP